MSDINVARNGLGKPIYWQLVEKLEREDAEPDTLTALMGMGIAALADEVTEEADWSSLSLRVSRAHLVIYVHAPQR